ncbi:MAG: hypothetical protein JNL47_02880 [Bacteroidia bacterium]|nr:hypothetical protein [Bacteroidia bacterium]
MVYIQNGGQYIALPVTVVATSTWSTSWAFLFELGSVIIQTQDSDGITPNPGNRTFKIVIVAGPAGLMNIDWNNYDEVKSRFQLME